MTRIRRYFLYFVCVEVLATTTEQLGEGWRTPLPMPLFIPVENASIHVGGLPGGGNTLSCFFLSVRIPCSSRISRARMASYFILNRITVLRLCSTSSMANYPAIVHFISEFLSCLAADIDNDDNLYIHKYIYLFFFFLIRAVGGALSGFQQQKITFVQRDSVTSRTPNQIPTHIENDSLFTLMVCERILHITAYSISVVNTDAYDQPETLISNYWFSSRNRFPRICECTILRTAWKDVLCKQKKTYTFATPLIVGVFFSNSRTIFPIFLDRNEWYSRLYQFCVPLQKHLKRSHNGHTRTHKPVCLWYETTAAARPRRYCVPRSSCPECAASAEWLMRDVPGYIYAHAGREPSWYYEPQPPRRPGTLTPRIARARAFSVHFSGD